MKLYKFDASEAYLKAQDRGDYELAYNILNAIYRALNKEHHSGTFRFSRYLCKYFYIDDCDAKYFTQLGYSDEEDIIKMR